MMEVLLFCVFASLVNAVWTFILPAYDAWQQRKTVKNEFRQIKQVRFRSRQKAT